MSALRLADADVDRAGGVADLQLQVPQHVEHRLDDALAPGGLLVGQEEQEIDVGARCERAAAVAAGRDDGELLGRGGIVGRVEVPHDAVVQGAHDAVHERRRAGARRRSRRPRAGAPPRLRRGPRRGCGAARAQAAHASSSGRSSLRRRGVRQGSRAAAAIDPGCGAPGRLSTPGPAHLASSSSQMLPVIVGFWRIIVGVLARHRRGRCPSSPGRRAAGERVDSSALRIPPQARRRPPGRRRLRSRTPRPFVITNGV